MPPGVSDASSCRRSTSCAWDRTGSDDPRRRPLGKRQPPSSLPATIHCGEKRHPKELLLRVSCPSESKSNKAQLQTTAKQTYAHIHIDIAATASAAAAVVAATIISSSSKKPISSRCDTHTQQQQQQQQQQQPLSSSSKCSTTRYRYTKRQKESTEGKETGRRQADKTSLNNSCICF